MQATKENEKKQAKMVYKHNSEAKNGKETRKNKATKECKENV